MFRRCCSTCRLALFAGVTGLSLAAAAPASAAVSWTSTPGGGNPNGLSSGQAGATTIDFNSGAAPGFFGGAVVGPGTTPGLFATPLDDLTKYYSAGPSTGSPASLTLGGPNNYFGLYWGSIDSYNTIQFFFGATLIASFTGTDINNPANGDQTSSATNRFVEFTFTGGSTFTGVLFFSSQNAFEFDNVAVANVEGGGPNVPEPASAALLGAALFGLGWARRKKH
ncbi:MAG: hypothetical protein JWM77_1574 [Rhodospirillales bacterium]|nr:hypothetical protein [Rhodospirillales bacterium]